jgi:hypothetical protein
MQNFETMVARYNSTLPTIANGEGQELQLTEKGILRVTQAKADGTSIVVTPGDTNNGGLVAYGVTTGSNTVVPVKMDSVGNVLVNVAEGIISVDFTPGNEMDTGTDEAGANPEPGVVAGITGSYQVVASEQIPNAFDFTADGLAQFQLVVDDGSTVEYIRTTLLPENQGTNQIVFPRPREITAANATTYIQLQAKSLRPGRSISAAGGINGYYPA